MSKYTLEEAKIIVKYLQSIKSAKLIAEREDEFEKDNFSLEDFEKEINSVKLGDSIVLNEHVKLVTRDELDERLNLHYLYLNNKDEGVKLDLTDYNLSCYNLKGTNLTGAILKGTNLTGADLTGADLSDADLTGADLTWVNLTRADLSGTDLTDANLTGANLNNTNLTCANLTNADLTVADVTGTIFAEAILDGVILKDVDRSNTYLTDMGYGEESDKLEPVSDADHSKITVPPEFGHILQVLKMGIDKGYEADGWLNKPESPTMSHKDNHSSMFRHLAESSAGVLEDHESGLHPLLHLATRALMGYTRYRRGVRSKKDYEK